MEVLVVKNKNDEYNFKNYLKNCPQCGGKLSEDTMSCPYCGEDLFEYNDEYRKKEQEINNEVDRTYIEKRQSEIDEKEFLIERKRKRVRIVIVSILCVILTFVGLITVGVVYNTSVENRRHKLASEAKEKLRVQNVKTVTLDELSFDGMIFNDTERPSVKENDEFYKLTLYSESYSNDAKFTVDVYIKKTETNKLSVFSEDYVFIRNDNMSLNIQIDNASYEKDTLDNFLVTEEGIKNTVRLDNIKIDDITFECYKSDNHYFLTANPEPQFYITYEVYFYEYDEDIKEKTIDEFNLMKSIKYKIS